MAYVERVNRAVDYVLAHLSQPLRLEDVARAARISPFHFHRIFRSLLGETLADFVKRRRLDRALYQMAHAPRMSLTEVALRSGFSSSSDFSRCFKKRFGTAPRAFDVRGWQASHGEDIELLTARQAALAGGKKLAAPDPAHLRRLPPGGNPDRFRVKLVELPARTVAYIRVRKPYQGMGVVAAAERLMAWAEQRGFADGQWLGYQWEDPELVPLDQCHYYVAVVVDDFRPAGEIGRYEFPPMVVAQVELRGDIELELRALQWLYKTWLPRSGYVPDDQPCFEAWIGRPFAHGMSHFELFAQLPVRRG